MRCCNKRGFSLLEVLIAIFLASIAMTAITQFFITQVNQYSWIAGSNALNQDLRTLSKYLEKDVRNAIKFHVFDTFNDAKNFVDGTTLTYPRYGNCVLFVQEVGMTTGGRGVVYLIENTLTNAGTSFQSYKLMRALVTFNSSKKVVEAYADLKFLTVAYIKPNSSEPVGLFGSPNKVFYQPARVLLPSYRVGLFIGTTLVKKGLHKQVSETKCNFCMYSRNPRFTK